MVVTGANGLVGQALCEISLIRSIDVHGVIRRPYGFSPNVKKIVVGDIDDKTDWSSALNGCDVIVHLAARVHVMRETSGNPLAEFRLVNVAGTEHLARCAVAAGVRRLVYVSSIKVNGEETQNGAAYTEQMLPAPQDYYGISKWEAEQALRRVAHETGLEVVIIRPPLVYGSGVKGNFEKMISFIKRGLPMPFASLCNKRSLIYVGNLVDALILCAAHPAAAGQTYLVSDGEDLSMSDLLEKLTIMIGMSPRLFAFPITLLKPVGYLTGKSKQIERLLGSLQVDSSKIRRELGWVPPYTVEQGLQNTMQKVN